MEKRNTVEWHKMVTDEVKARINKLGDVNYKDVGNPEMSIQAIRINMNEFEGDVIEFMKCGAGYEHARVAIRIEPMLDIAVIAIELAAALQTKKDISALGVDEAFSVKENALLIAESLHQLTKRKNADYGDSVHITYSKFGPVTLCLRVNDKINRLISLSKKQGGPLVEDESFSDTVQDLANYAIMSCVEIIRASVVDVIAEDFDIGDIRNNPVLSKLI